jgi:ferritin-like metal-binding protein YciE
MQVDGLQSLYVEQLRVLHSAERRIVQELPGMIQAASSPDLRSALEEQLGIAREQLAQLNRVLESLGEEENDEDYEGPRRLSVAPILAEAVFS